VWQTLIFKKYYVTQKPPWIDPHVVRLVSAFRFLVDLLHFTVIKLRNNKSLKEQSLLVNVYMVMACTQLAPI